MDSSNKKDRFVKMLKENKGILYKVIRAYCKNNDEWPDLEQEIIIQLWKSFDRYDDNYRLSTWLYRIALNVAISYYRKTAGSRQTLSIDAAIITLTADPEEVHDSRREMLYTFINTLDEINKALILLHLEDYSYKEISEIVGFSETNVSTKLNRIKNKFKATIATQV